MAETNDNTGNLIKSIFELHHSIISLFFKNFEEIFELPKGLNFTHMKAAMTLGFHGDMTMSELSKKLVMEKGSFTPVAAKLIKKGIIRKEQSIEDKRVYNLVLTEKGCELTNTFKKAHREFMMSTLEQLLPEERDGYLEMVKGLNQYNAKIKNGRA